MKNYVGCGLLRYNLVQTCLLIFCIGRIFMLCYVAQHKVAILQLTDD